MKGTGKGKHIAIKKKKKKKKSGKKSGIAHLNPKVKSWKISTYNFCTLEAGYNCLKGLFAVLNSSAMQHRLK